MTSVLGYARTFFVGGSYWPDDLPTLQDEIVRFHDMLADLARHVEAGAPFLEDMTPERMLQGPFADAMTHAGQLALLRRLAGSPVPPENFLAADINAARLGPDQPAPVSPDPVWPEAPSTWIGPPARQSSLRVVEEEGVKAIEGRPGDRFLSDVGDAARLVEACFSNRTRSALLYADNLPASFFDLSSGQLGAILQKLRTYGVRLAVVCPPDRVRFSTRFEDMLAGERQQPYFGVFETRSAARDWLASTSKQQEDAE